MKKDPKLGLFSYLDFILRSTSMQIYLARDNQQAGPYTVEQLNQMLSAQQVLLTDLIWHEGMTEWKILGELTQGQYQYYPTGYQAPIFNPQPQAAQPSQSIHLSKSHQLSETAELASISARSFAKMIDLCLWIPASLILSALLTNEQRLQIMQLQTKGMQLIQQEQFDAAEQLTHQMLQIIPATTWAVFFGYLILMLVGQAYLLYKTGQTVGKKVMNIQIVDAETQQVVGVNRSFTLRSLITIIITLIALPIFPIYTMIDYLFALGKKRQTLHDVVAKTIVIQKK